MISNQNQLLQEIPTGPHSRSQLWLQTQIFWVHGGPTQLWCTELNSGTIQMWAALSSSSMWKAFWWCPSLLSYGTTSSQEHIFSSSCWVWGNHMGLFLNAKLPSASTGQHQAFCIFCCTGFHPAPPGCTWMCSQMKRNFVWLLMTQPTLHLTYLDKGKIKRERLCKSEFGHLSSQTHLFPCKQEENGWLTHSSVAQQLAPGSSSMALNVSLANIRLRF